MMAKQEAGTPATAALTKAGIAFTVHAYTHDPRQRSFGEEAASALGLDPAEVFKTLIVTVDGTLAVAIVPVDSMLDPKAFASAVGGRRAGLADQAEAQRVTGYVVGGISPIGQKKPLPTVLDDSAVLRETIYVSGGRRGLDIGISPDDLVHITGALLRPIARTA